MASQRERTTERRGVLSRGSSLSPSRMADEDFDRLQHEFYFRLYTIACRKKSASTDACGMAGMTGTRAHRRMLSMQIGPWVAGAPRHQGGGARVSRWRVAISG